jgi:hypothetical protein
VRRCSGGVVLGKVLKEMAEGDARARSSLADQVFFFSESKRLAETPTLIWA